MRALIALVSIILFVLPHAAYAVFYNDSDVIEIGDGLPSEGSQGGTDAGSGAGDTGGGTFGTGDGSTGGSGSSSSGGSSDSSGSSGGGGSGGGGGGSGGSSGGTGDTQETLIDALVAGGGIDGLDNGSLGSVGGSAGANGSAGTSGSGTGSVKAGGSGGGGSIVHIVGAKVRAALQDTVDLRQMLQYWVKKGTGAYSASDYGLIAASTAVRDANVQEVSFTASAFEIVYRSQGYMVGLIPWSFPVRVAIVPDAASASDRVQVKLPWYRFFMRTFFTSKSLAGEIDTVIADTKKANTDPQADGKALVFDAVAKFLKQKVGTIQDSIILGTPAS